MSKAGSFKDLFVWQKAYKLAVGIFKWARELPRGEASGLAEQIKRAAVSIPSNVAEGYGRQHSKEYGRFLSVSYGSLCELETQYLLAIELGYAQRSADIDGLLKEVGAMLYRMLHPRPKTL